MKVETDVSGRSVAHLKSHSLMLILLPCL